MTNNKQSSVEKMFQEMIEIQQSGKKLTFDENLALLEKYKAMHKEEIEASYSDGYKEGYNRALEYITDTIKNKIEIKEDANNEFRKGTANTTGTTFLCTEFVSDQLFYKGTLPHCMRCGKPQYQHPIISNTQ